MPPAAHPFGQRVLPPLLGIPPLGELGPELVDGSLEDAIPVDRVASPKQILETRRHVAELYIDERIVDYIVEIVHATRNPEQAGLAELKPLIEFGASPRATLSLAQGSRAHAFLRGRAFVTPDDVKAIAPDVLRHRVLRTYEAEAEEKTSETVIQKIFDELPVP